jgi:hypothetical protein
MGDTARKVIEQLLVALTLNNPFENEKESKETSSSVSDLVETLQPNPNQNNTDAMVNFCHVI